MLKLSQIHLDLARFLAVFALAVALLVLRRPDHLALPAVWNEDGAIILPELLNYGEQTVFWPVNGYLIVASRLVSAAALKLSFEHYALVAIVLSLVAQPLCVSIIAVAPSHLPARFACALVPPLVPTDPEVLLTPLYTFWWAGLLWFPALLWRIEARQWPRLVLIVIAGLSSPIGLLLSPLFLARCVWDRTKGNIVAAVVVLAVVVIQVGVMVQQPSAQPTTVGIKTVYHVFQKFLGFPFLDIAPRMAFLLGLFIVFILIFGLFSIKSGDRFVYTLLLLSLGCVIMASALRVPTDAIHPVLAGPRYFFYPTVVLIWLLIWLWKDCSGWMNALSLAGFLIVIMSPLRTTFARKHEGLLAPWESQVAQCAASETYAIQIHADGRRNNVWRAELSGRSCREALGRQLF